MFQLMSRETELAHTIIQYVKLQRAYHESALHCLEELIPGLESYISKYIDTSLIYYYHFIGWSTKLVVQTDVEKRYKYKLKIWIDVDNL